MFVAYLRTFSRMGLTSVPMRADTGPIGGDLSHEFIILPTPARARCSATRRCSNCRFPARTPTFSGDLAGLVAPFLEPYAATDEMHDQATFEAKVPRIGASRRAASRSATSSISAPNIPPMGAVVTGPDGKDVPVEMGSYGIGPSRLVPPSSKPRTMRMASSGQRPLRPSMSA
jgi:prolyl-tRNA synthetase